ncbi:hypothetical protein [Brevibacillus laterosporus]|uniref:VCBS repeat-containing protein n=1 Tax=Brevibacillus laterosporus TaxID=1465 RepID=A0AAP8QBP3_BRELA|nr:hypothetical protein [Brevibacillus laterosporus]MCR8980970.1 hypothetical protein [Brevibacillus laterosporus]MCZ0808125.1 hypothetical protein [Brevibacillus laterosporus]MCZ0826317.1 hypothetical protein [Brevibacillus laterosporus]MCZ0850200.1 hypothetical protein [Brevibacillus laterosporus]PPA98088.1 hypothetical protein C4A77_14780 [Brevibacillus laterosporus]
MKTLVKVVTSVALCGGVFAGVGAVANVPVFALDTQKALQAFEVGAPFSLKDLQVKPNSYVLDYTQADLTGDGVADGVTLIGTKEKGYISVRDIMVVMQDGKTMKFTQVPVGKQNAGYEPKLTVGDFNKDGAQDVLVEMGDGGSGGTSTYSLLSFKDGKGAAMVDQEKLNAGVDFDIQFKEGFKAEITNKATKEKTTVDISENKAQYIKNGIYDAKGKLLKAVEGAQDGFGSLEVVEQADGGLTLVGTQHIWGSYHADSIAMATSTWKIENGQLKLEKTEVTAFDHDNFSIAPNYVPGDKFTEAALSTKENNYIIDSKYADVNGDGVRDEVILIGHKEEGEKDRFATDLTVAVKDGKTKKLTMGTVGKENTGYDEATLYIGAFNTDKHKDILVSAPTGGSGGLSTFSLLTFSDNKIVPLADQELLNKGVEYDVVFKDGFKVEISSKATGKKETLDVSKNKKEYVETKVYDNNGKLLQETTGWADGLSVLTPVDVDKNGALELQAVQSISGAYHADRLGAAKTTWTLKNGKLELTNEALELRK